MVRKLTEKHKHKHNIALKQKKIFSLGILGQKYVVVATEQT